MRMVVVGLDPGQDGRDPLDPGYPSGSRLAGLMGLDAREFLDRTDRVNLRPGTDDSTPDAQAAANLRPLLRGRRVLALGRRVAECLGTPAEWMQWDLCGDFVGASLPHPSGLSRWWNDSGNVREAGAFLSRSILPCVHLEGTDGSGKTTLMRWLEGVVDWEQVPTDDPPRDWDECLARIGGRLRPGTVCDRSSGLVSELVYGPVLRGGTVTDEGEMWRVVRAVSGHVTFVYCRPPNCAILPSFREGEDPAHVEGVRSRAGDLITRYDEVITQMVREGCRVVRYDRTRQTVGEVLRCVG